jgi:fructokinase
MKCKLVGIGEILWDLLPGGRQLGGAPANFVYHALALGADARVISRVGADDLGRDLITRLKELSVPSDCVSVDREAPTGTVQVEVDPHGEPHYIIHEGVAWDRLRAESAELQTVADADAVCFGTLAQRQELARAAIRTLLQATPARALRILDVNLRQHYYSPSVLTESLALANVLKLNETELPRLSETLSLAGNERDQIQQMAERYALRVVAYTRGERGSLLMADGQWSDDAGIPATVQDTVGAGDSFTAAMTLGLLAGWNVEEINRRANEIAAYVAASAGATPTMPDALCLPFRSLHSLPQPGECRP